MADRIGFIGAGSLASGLALALHAIGYEVTAVASKSGVSAQRLASLVPGIRAVAHPVEVAALSDLVFIATPDSVIHQVARSVDWRAGQGVVHCSGALSLEPLSSASASGASVASFHPLQTLSCIQSPQEAADRLSGACYALETASECDDWLSRRLHQMASDLGGQVINIAPDDRALYHQAAVFACGYITTLLNAAEEMWTHMGFSSDQARAALVPLARTTVANYHRVGATASVTGPIPRGDAETVHRQMDALRAALPHLSPLASELGLRSLPFAPPQDRQPLSAILQPASGSTASPSHAAVAPAPDR